MRFRRASVIPSPTSLTLLRAGFARNLLSRLRDGRSLVPAVLGMTLFVATALSAQLQRDVLAGHITGPNGPVAGATISVLAAGAPPGTFAQTARSDAEGRWLVAVQEGSGEYTVRVTAIGMTPKSTTVKRGEPHK